MTSPRDNQSSPAAAQTQASAPTGVLVTPAMIAVICSLAGLLALAAGAIGSYTVTGWRVTALETRAAIIEADIRTARSEAETGLRAARDDASSQDKRLAVVEEQIRQLVKGVERVEGATQRIESKLDAQRVPARQPRRPTRRFLRPAWRSRVGFGPLHPPH